MRKALFAGLGLLLCCILLLPPASASVIVASGAGALPGTAEDLTGDFPTEIVGILDFPNGVSMFKIDILNAAIFSAITEFTGAHGVPDTELFLFDSTGVGVYMNDDIDVLNTQSCLPSNDISNPCSSGTNGFGPTANGVYYLAITRSANLPVGMNGELFLPLLSTDVAGPVLTDPITDWDNAVNSSPNSDQVNYDIILTGTVPEPATWTLTAVAGLVLLLLRRKLHPR